MINKFHPFHIISISPWPIISSILALILTSQTAIGIANKVSTKTIQLSSALTIITTSA